MPPLLLVLKQQRPIACEATYVWSETEGQAGICRRVQYQFHRCQGPT